MGLLAFPVQLILDRAQQHLGLQLGQRVTWTVQPICQRLRKSGEKPPYTARDEHPTSIIALMNMPYTPVEDGSA